jgi:WD repeat and SOF domain-containing protein 1
MCSPLSLPCVCLLAATPIRKVIMTMRGNAVAWNPMEAFNLSVANEDHNVYTFDMRRLDTALNVHQDHVRAPPRKTTHRPTVSAHHSPPSRVVVVVGRRFLSLKVAAVLDIDYSPTGEEFVTGSYDRTLRIFRRSEGRSRYATPHHHHTHCRMMMLMMLMMMMMRAGRCTTQSGCRGSSACDTRATRGS